MRKYFIGWAAGVAMTLAFSAHAEDIANLIGLQVEGSFPVTVNGEKLDQPAAVIQGSAYLPVRAVGNALGAEVAFDSDMGIQLKTGGDTTVPVSQASIEAKQRMEERAEKRKLIIEKSDAIKKLQEQRDAEVKIRIPAQEIVKAYGDPLSPKQYTQEQYNEAKKVYDEQTAKMADIDKQIADLQAQLDELNKQQ